MKNRKKLFLSSLVFSFLIQSTAFAERTRERNEINSGINSRTESPFVINTGFSATGGLPNLSINYNIFDRFSLGAGLGYYYQFSSRGENSISANEFRLIANGKIYLFDLNQNISIYTETDAGIITGERITDSGNIFSPSQSGQLSTTGLGEFLFAQKLGLEARYVKGISFNVAWGVFYETLKPLPNEPFLDGLFKNSFVPLAIDLLFGYSF